MGRVHKQLMTRVRRHLPAINALEQALPAHVGFQYCVPVVVTTTHEVSRMGR